MIDFFQPLDRIPTVTAQMKRVDTRGGRPRFYDSPELKQTRQLFLQLLRPHAPQEPFKGPVSLTTVWIFPLPKARKVKPGAYKITKPDTDNLLKLFKDCMAEAGYFENDSRVCSETTIKIYNDQPGIFVKVEELPAGANLWEALAKLKTGGTKNETIHEQR